MKDSFAGSRFWRDGVVKGCGFSRADCGQPEIGALAPAVSATKEYSNEM
jgi:hypothetical protein